MTRTEYAETKVLKIKEKEVAVDLLLDVVKKYLEYLILVGLLKVSLSGQIYAVIDVSHSDTYGEYSRNLKYLINNVDGYSPEVNQLIFNSIYDFEKEYIKKTYIIIDTNTVYIDYFERNVDAKHVYGMKDRFGKSWYKCLLCNEIKRDYEFAEVSSIFGVCKDCSNVAPKLNDLLNHNQKENAYKLPAVAFVLDTYITGSSYIPDVDETIKSLHIGEKLYLYREPDNIYDKNAIVIKTIDDKKLGYVPKVDNYGIALNMDNGKYCFAKVLRKKTNIKHIKIYISIYIKN